MNSRGSALKAALIAASYITVETGTSGHRSYQDIVFANLVRTQSNIRGHRFQKHLVWPPDHVWYQNHTQRFLL